MKNNITNREDLFLAKIAGYDVDIKTMTPPTYSNIREKLLLEIADMVNNGSAGGGGSNTPLEVECTTIVDAQTHKQTITTNITAAELFSAVSLGKAIISHLKFPSGEDTVSITKVIYIDAQVIEGTLYEFTFTSVSDDDGIIGFFTASLSAGDTVVFQQV